ncbi:hypothetical protein [Serratia sp. JSRIV004]|uniref:hypothetical protein n=1 Tax=Serratia sp. JSRIV004 TaxID=2831895 RepID=UPI001CBEBD5F|nr:hypothetical protein [Serratia sp. JSRIV004]UAN58998.1 hypothetical protein KGP21_08100 [Serratia sp. JSRIV004]UAN59625.1 hypothetical protein KGP21_11475 [Serratia sp. JSRIV004]
MSNAKNEFLEHTKSNPRVSCAEIIKGDCWRGNAETLTLRKDYSEQEFNDFLEQLNFEYNSGFGSQELFGTIWHEDGTWSERGEYDGSEWWEFKKVPEIPDGLISKKEQADG